MRVVLSMVFISWVFTLNAQDNNYLSDLTALKTLLQKTASYKTQIKGDKQTQYNELINRLSKDSTNQYNSYQYFFQLTQLLFPLKDNHLGFYEIPDYKNFTSVERIDSFAKSKLVLNYPTYSINIDSLKVALSKKPLDSIEGIYHYDKYYRVGLFKKESNEYIGVVLDSETNLWLKGQIAIHLYELAPNLFKAIYGHPLFKTYTYQPIEKFQHQSLVNAYFYGSYSQSVYTKKWPIQDYINIPRDAAKFSFRQLNNSIQYLSVRTFQANTYTAQLSQKFYDSIKNELTANNLILDLRNNEGGAEKEMAKYLKLMKEYVKNGHLYVLVNNNTLSQGELFVLKLKQLKNVTIVGGYTKGMMAYGSNYGRTEKLPSGKFAFYPTDMVNGSELLQYEDLGIQPDVFLRDGQDWIAQLIELIQKK